MDFKELFKRFPVEWTKYGLMGVDACCEMVMLLLTDTTKTNEDIYNILVQIKKDNKEILNSLEVEE